MQNYMEKIIKNSLKMSNIKYLYLFIIVSVLSHINAQTGYKNTYEFLSLPVSSRITALGGSVVALKDDDLNMAIANPASGNENHHGAIAFNHNFHFADISNGSFQIGKYFSKWGISSHAAFSYINYGEFQFTDEYDVNNGTFKASERALILGGSKKLNDRITAGLNIKTIFSSLESYRSLGLATDLSLVYFNPDKDLAFNFLIKNLGGELKTYHNARLSAPLDIQIGYSRRLKHLPLRFSLIAHQLQQWDVRYDDPNLNINTNLFGETSEKSAFSKNIDNLFRHLLFNVELSLGSSGNFKIRSGYNHFRRKELSLSTFRSMAGFSLGFGIKIKQFNLDYGLGYFHLAGANNHLSIATNINRFKKKK